MIDRYLYIRLIFGAEAPVFGTGAATSVLQQSVNAKILDSLSTKFSSRVKRIFKGNKALSAPMSGLSVLRRFIETVLKQGRA